MFLFSKFYSAFLVDNSAIFLSLVVGLMIPGIFHTYSKIKDDKKHITDYLALLITMMIIVILFQTTDVDLAKSSAVMIPDIPEP